MNINHVRMKAFIMLSNLKSFTRNKIRLGLRAICWRVDPEKSKFLRKVNPKMDGKLNEHAVKSNQFFGLYRIIGNELQYIHSKGQNTKNLEFIIENERDFRNCSKCWILNRISEKKNEEELARILKNNNCNYMVIEFNRDTLIKTRWNWSILDHDNFKSPYKFARLTASEQNCLFTEIYKNKNNYMMNVNGARNKAIEDGKNKYDWTLPCDGNCFFTEEAWNSLVQTTGKTRRSQIAYIPMKRVSENYDLLKGKDMGPKTDEPQIMFSKNSAIRFDTEYVYGRRDKVELLWRVGVRQGWIDDFWDQPRKNIGMVDSMPQKTGWVARLSRSGGKEKRSKEKFIQKPNKRERGELRNLGGLCCRLIKLWPVIFLTVL